MAWRGIGLSKSKLPASWGSFQCWRVAGRFQWASSSRGHPWVPVSLPTYSTARWKQFISPSSLSGTPVMVSPLLSLSSLSKPWGWAEGNRSTQQSSMVQSCWQPSSTPSPWLLIICYICLLRRFGVRYSPEAFGLSSRNLRQCGLVWPQWEGL